MCLHSKYFTWIIYNTMRFLYQLLKKISGIWGPLLAIQASRRFTNFFPDFGRYRRGTQCNFPMNGVLQIVDSLEALRKNFVLETIDDKKNFKIEEQNYGKYPFPDSYLILGQKKKIFFLTIKKTRFFFIYYINNIGKITWIQIKRPSLLANLTTQRYS